MEEPAPRTLRLQTSAEDRETRILVGRGARRHLGRELDALLPDGPFALIADGRVLELWGGDLLGRLPEPRTVIPLPRGEAAKDPEVLIDTCRRLVRAGIPRNGFVLSFGGGAAGDLAGLAAGLHSRGIPFVQVPTTLLGMVDAGLGGKCAVNLPEGKNLFGLFHSPRLLLVDPDFLTTLPARELRSGLGEMAKYALGFSRELFDACLERAPGEPDEAVIFPCLEIKAGIVEVDPFERRGRRVLLNLGHSFAHVFEGHALREERPLPHGLAVSLGLRAASNLAVEEGLLSPEERSQAFGVLDHLGLPGSLSEAAPDLPAPGPERARTLLLRDKKNVSGKVQLVLPRGLGACELREIPLERALQALLGVS